MFIKSEVSFQTNIIKAGLNTSNFNYEFFTKAN